MSHAESGQLQTIVKTVLRPVMRFAWRITVEGAHNVPTTGSAILAPNHTSVLDSFFVPLVLHRRITYVGKAEYLDDWKTRRLFPALGMIPIDRSGGDASSAALDAAARCSTVASCSASTRKAPGRGPEPFTRVTPAWRAWRCARRARSSPSG